VDEPRNPAGDPAGGLGLPPGTPVHVGAARAGKVRVTVIDYDAHDLRQKEIAAVEELSSSRDSPSVTWINVDGLHDTKLLENIARAFGLHHLILEDILNTTQRPKFEESADTLFVVAKMLEWGPAGLVIPAEHVSIILGAGFVISFQERPGDVFEPIRQRIRTGKGRIRKMGADYLAYSLLDAIVDKYFIVIDDLGGEIEDLEERVESDPSTPTLSRLRRLRQQVLFLRRSIWPMREVVSALAKSETPMFAETLAPYLRDLYDHTIQVMDIIETLRDGIAGMFDVYMSSVSNRMNDVMKVLTIIATVFIPITFIAGLYGMNFKFMPEVQWRWGYPIVLLIMAAAVAAMLFYFRRRKWL